MQLTKLLEVQATVTPGGHIEDHGTEVHHTVTSVPALVASHAIMPCCDEEVALTSAIHKVPVYPTEMLVARDVFGMKTSKYLPGLTPEFFRNRMAAWQMNDVIDAMRKLSEIVTTVPTVGQQIFGLRTGMPIRRKSRTMEQLSTSLLDGWGRVFTPSERTIVRDVMAACMAETDLLFQPRRSTFITARNTPLHPTLADMVEDVSTSTFLSVLEAELPAISNGSGVSAIPGADRDRSGSISVDIFINWVGSVATVVLRAAAAASSTAIHVDTYLAAVQLTLLSSVADGAVAAILPSSVVNSSIIAEGKTNATILSYLKERTKTLPLILEAQEINITTNPIEIILTDPEYAFLLLNTTWSATEDVIGRWLRNPHRFRRMPVMDALDAIHVQPSISAVSNTIVGGVIRVSVAEDAASVLTGPGVYTASKTTAAQLDVLEPLAIGHTITNRVLDSYHSPAPSALLTTAALYLADLEQYAGAQARVHTWSPSEHFLECAAMALSTQVNMLVSYDRPDVRAVDAKPGSTAKQIHKSSRHGNLATPSSVAFEYVLSRSTIQYAGFYSDWQKIFCPNAHEDEAIADALTDEEGDDVTIDMALPWRPSTVSTRLSALAAVYGGTPNVNVYDPILALLLAGSREPKKKYDLANQPDVSPWLMSAYVTQVDPWLNSLDCKVSVKYNGEALTVVAPDGKKTNKGITFTANLQDMLVQDSGIEGYILTRPNETYTQTVFLELLDAINTMGGVTRPDGDDTSDLAKYRAHLIAEDIPQEARRMLSNVWARYGVAIVQKHGSDTFANSSKIRQVLNACIGAGVARMTERDRAEIHIGAMTVSLLLTHALFAQQNKEHLNMLLESLSTAIKEDPRTIADSFTLPDVAN